MRKKSTKKEKLYIKPCPFCGSPILNLWDNEEEVKEGQYVERNGKRIKRLLDYEAGIECRCGVNVTFDFGTAYPYNAEEAREWAAYLWNQRA